MYIYYDELIRKDIILYGTGKFQQDVEDFFCELSVQCYIDDIKKSEQLHERKIISPNELTRDELSNNLIIICDFDYSKKKSTLESLGFQYKNDFILGIDLINILEERETFELVNYAPNKKIIIFGTGAAAKQLMAENTHLRVHYFIDNDKTKWGETFFNKQVKSVDELKNENLNEIFVLVVTSFIDEAKEQLRGLGLEFGKNFYFYEIFNKINPARLLEETIRCTPRYKYDCDGSLYPAQIVNGGLVRICCKMSIGAGNILLNSFDNIDRSVYAKIIRLGIINRTYTLCKEENCTFLMSEKKKDACLSINEIERSKNKVSDYTLTSAKMQPSYDKTCNYKCKSCRDHIIVSDYENDVKLRQVHEEFVKLLPKFKNLSMAGGGEVFASKFYKDILLDKYKYDSVSILTNGSLLNEAICSKLLNKYKNITLNVSLHAANSETYRKLHDADFNVVYNNLKMIADVRANNCQINVFKLLFTVQRDNFRDMIAFIELGLKLNVDNISFKPILKWPVISDEEFKELNVYDPMNPYHEEFLGILEHSLFQNSKVELVGM